MLTRFLTWLRDAFMSIPGEDGVSEWIEDKPKPDLQDAIRRQYDDDFDFEKWRPN